jgi:O-antigen/teichoic acid export membrane protein
MIVGYFSLFDLGLGRTLTHLVAEKLGAGQHAEIPVLVWTSLLLMLALGLVGALILVLLSAWLVYYVLKIPEALQHETLGAFYLLAIALPIVTSTTGLRGVLEAQQRFDLTNVVRVSMGVFTFLGPIIVLPFAQDLWSIIAILVAGRAIALVVHLALCLHAMPTLRSEIAFNFGVVRPLIRFGSWMAVCNIVSPLMVYVDRLLIGALLSVTDVTYYATPFEVVTKLLVIPWALAGVLFPAFSSIFVQDTRRTAYLYYRGMKYAFLLLLPITVVTIIFAKDILLLWLGSEFADQSFRVMQILVVGVLINGAAQVPSVLVQGMQRPDITAKLYLLELPLYLAFAFVLINRYGIEGAAASWLLRVTIDACLLLYMAYRLLTK